MAILPRSTRHGLYLRLMKAMARVTPGSSYMAFAGSGSSSQLCRHLGQLGVRRALIVTDRPLRELGLVDRATRALGPAGVEAAIFDGVRPDPTFSQIAAGADAFRQYDADAVLAVGGGSSMDAAKVIAACAGSDEDPRRWVGFGKIRHAMPKIYAVPTTAGTGSEATIGAVVSDDATHEKAVISAPSLLPAAAALDPDLLLGLPRPITAATGMDALTHAVEAYICTWNRGTAREKALAAVRLIFRNLETACREGENPAAREAMSIAAYYAGIAINQVNVGNVHAIAHQIGGKYGIPHGVANSLVLPHVLEFSFEETRPRLAELAAAAGVARRGASEEENARAFIEAVRELRRTVGLPERSDDIRAEDYGYLCGLALRECEAYPVPRLLDRDSTLEILSAITTQSA
ncbi:MAG: iron-containing alcohol dehydrogenase [Gammaproteobacteria bacterium]